MKKIGRLFLILVGLMICLVAVSALSNLGLPTRSESVETLNAAEKARLQEYFHLRETLGDEIWAGWGSAEIPVIVHNEAYAFLVGYQGTPPDGWIMAPSGERRGGKWEEVPGDLFFDQVYYRQPLTSPEKTPENFTVRVGDRWVATMMTRDYAKIKMVSDMRGDFPPVIRSVIPYRLIWKVVLGDTETYIGGLAHESFHAFQGTRVPDQFNQAESVHGWAERYPWEDTGFQEDWKAELDTLVKAVFASSLEETKERTKKYLSERSKRREEANLTPRQVDYERNREWLEGMAKYVELTIQRRAGENPSYQPASAVQADPNFSNYSNRERYWRQQVNEIKRMAGRDGEIRFYYTGFAQGVLLDRLMPDWKSRLWAEDVWLEELLREAVQ